MDSELLAEMFDFIQEQNYGIHSVTVMRYGYLVADATIYPFGLGLKHEIHSATKSIISALIGIAIEQGYIESVNQPVLNLFPKRTAANLDADKEAMTLEHLLMMATGLECRDSYLYRWRGIGQMRQTDDWIQFMLDLPMAEAPGTSFEYCNGASFLLSAIIQETTGMSASAFAEDHLFGPLGISDVAWPANPQGITLGWGELRMRPHDMAKIGYLFLNEGRWDGEQIVPEAWVADSTRKHISATLQDGYGYQWWISEDGTYMALGYAGQFIFVIPERDLVVAFTSDLSENDFYVPEILLDTFIIPAVKSSTPLPPNHGDVELLESKIREVALPHAEPEAPPPLPEIAQTVSGQTYLLDPNPLGYLSFSLTFQEEAQALLNWTYIPEEGQLSPVDPQDSNQAEYPVGLDNVYRFAPGDYGIPMGLKGWWQSEETFIIHFDYIGNTGQGQARFTFEGDQVTVQIREYGQAQPELSGRLEA
jgi:CubicO group peptidase (beta-lactamase class C family)